MESWTDGCSGARCFLWDQMNDTEGKRMSVEEDGCEANFTYEEFWMQRSCVIMMRMEI
jgi:hypothetical protein